MKELDIKDRKILAILSKEARIPLKTLAARIGLSRSATTERMASLEKSGAIKGYRADIGQIGHHVVWAFLLIELVRTPSHGTLDRLATRPEVRRVSSVSGHLDLVVEIAASSVEGLNDIRDLIAADPEVRDLTTLMVLRRELDR